MLHHVYSHENFMLELWIAPTSGTPISFFLHGMAVAQKKEERLTDLLGEGGGGGGHAQTSTGPPP